MPINSESVIMAVIVNLVGINLLLISGKVENSDAHTLLFKTPTSPNVYLYKNNTLRHIPDPETFNLLGLRWSDVVLISDKELNTYKMSTPITSILEMQLIRYKGIVYGVTNDKIRVIPGESSLKYILDSRIDRKILTRNQQLSIQDVNEIQFNSYKKDEAFVLT